jgi:hypothetical protein
MRYLSRSWSTLAVALAIAVWFAPLFINVKGRSLEPSLIKASANFQRGGLLSGGASGPPNGDPYWSSWCGDDANTGRLEMGPFPAPSNLCFYLRGYPSKPGLQIYLESLETGERLAFASGVIGEYWQRCLWTLPKAWRNQPVKLVGVDDAKEWAGWFAISEPRTVPVIAGLGYGYWGRLYRFLTVGFVVALVGLAVIRQVSSRMKIPEGMELAFGFAGVALAGYAIWILAVLNPFFGRAGVAATLVWAVITVVRSQTSRGPSGMGRWTDRDLPIVGAITVAAGVLYLSMLICYSPDSTLSLLAGSRFRESMPTDNEIPQFYAERLWNGAGAKDRYGDWLSSDRPPLQEGWILLCGAPVAAVDHNFTDNAQYAGIWMQLVWVAAGWAWLRAVGIDRVGATAILLGLTATGLFAFNTVYVWPKMAAAGFLIIAYTLLFETPETRGVALLGGAGAALACLSHGGVAFAGIALIPIVLASLRRTGIAKWMLACGVFGSLMLPWFFYQAFYDPPGNRLLKWHLAGVIQPDSRGFGNALAAAYRNLGWNQWLHARLANLSMIGGGSPLEKISFGRDSYGLLTDEWRRFVPSLGWWGIVSIVPVALILSKRGRFWKSARVGLAWVLMSLLVWDVLMFIPFSTGNHQGTYAFQLMALLVMAGALWRWWRPAFWLVVALQAADFFRIWLPPPPAAIVRVLQPSAAAMIALSVCGLAALYFSVRIRTPKSE